MKIKLELQFISRKEIGYEKCEINNKLSYKDSEGFVGMAKMDPVILGRNIGIEALAEKIYIKHVPNDIINDETELKKFFKDEFNIDDEKFKILSPRKLLIKSYLAIGFMSPNLDKVAIIIIDSLIENAFIDFEIFNNILVNYGLEAIVTAQELVIQRTKGEDMETNSDSPESSKLKDIDIKMNPLIYFKEMIYAETKKINQALMLFTLINIIEIMHDTIYRKELNHEEE